MAITLTPAQLAKLHDKQVSNLLKKMEAGKTLTAREQSILSACVVPAAQTAGTPDGFLFDPESDPTKLRYARTWDELAAALRVDDRTLYNFRKSHSVEIHRLTRPPTPKDRLLTRADGTHIVAHWRAFADEIGELKGRGLNNAALGPEAAIDERQLRLRERLFEVERAEHKLAAQKRAVLPLTEFQDALRILVSAFDGALKQIPGRVAERVVEAARQALLALLRAELTAPQFAKCSALLEKAPCDHATIARILEEEIEAPRRVLAEADFLPEEEPAPADTAAAV